MNYLISMNNYNRINDNKSSSSSVTNNKSSLIIDTYSKDRSETAKLPIQLNKDSTMQLSPELSNINKMNEIFKLNNSQSSDANDGNDVNCINVKLNEIHQNLDFLDTHPQAWNREEVRLWLEWCANEYALSDIPFNKFTMNGKALWLLTEDMFKKRVPNSGDILYKALQNLIPKTSNQLKDTDYSEDTVYQNIVKKYLNENENINEYNDDNNSDINDQQDQNNHSTMNVNDENLIIDENSNNSNSDLNLKMKNNKKRSAPANTSTNGANKPFEKKRTANLENVIGNLKNRKMVKPDTTDDFANPLLSPSASSAPSSVHSFSPNTKKQFNKQNWLLEQNEQLLGYCNGNGSAIDSANGTASSPSSSTLSIRCCDHDSDILKENLSHPSSSRPSSACASETGQSTTTTVSPTINFYKTETKSLIQAKIQAQPLGKNLEDPTRQIKFYDDYIDFRGDILRRPPNSKNCRILWEYLYTLLQDDAYNSIIRWEDSVQMVFRIVQAEKLAALWGLQKNRLGMTYEKLSRGMRYYYPNNIIAREPGRRLLYRFMRHPSDIKKFVKKNGTYMLKKTKAETKGKKAVIDVIDEKIDVPCDGEFDAIEDECINDSGLEEPVVAQSNATIEKPKQQKITKTVDSSVKQHSNCSPSLLNTNLFQSNSSSNGNNNNNNNTAAALQRFLPNFYPYFTAQMAAAAAAAMQQQQSQTQTNFFQRSSTNDEVAAAQFLMQLRNTTEPLFQQQLQQMNSKKHSINDLQQFENNIKKYSNKKFKSENEDDDVEDEQEPQQQSQQPLNLCKKRKPIRPPHIRVTTAAKEDYDGITDMNIKVEN